VSPRGRVPEPTLVGHYAGPVTRLAACALDVAILNLVFAVGISAIAWIVEFVSGYSFDSGDVNPAVSSLMLATWAFLYFWVPWSLSGSTPGMAIAGLRVVSRDGQRLGRGQAAVRVITWPLSLLILGLGFLGIVFGREHRALHDVLARSAVVYSWDARAARIRFLAQRAPVKPAAEGAPSAG